jgi:hypothetical protein
MFPCHRYLMDVDRSSATDTPPVVSAESVAVPADRPRASSRAATVRAFCAMRDPIHDARQTASGCQREYASSHLERPLDHRFARRVRAARFACSDRALAERFRAARLACVASARCEAADRPSFFSARNVARERSADGFAEDPRRTSRSACLRVRGLTSVPLGAGSFTPARLAFERPMAIACLVERAPCLPSRMCSISSRTNSPACVDGAFPSRASRRARSSVCRSGTVKPPDQGVHESRPSRPQSEPAAGP